MDNDNLIYLIKMGGGVGGCILHKLIHRLQKDFLKSDSVWKETGRLLGVTNVLEVETWLTEGNLFYKMSAYPLSEGLIPSPLHVVALVKAGVGIIFRLEVSCLSLSHYKNWMHIRSIEQFK